MATEVTGVQIVPCTGIYTYDYLAPDFENRSEDEIPSTTSRDIQDGIQGTDIRVGSSHPASDTGPQQVDILLEEGVHPAKVPVAHTGNSDDLDYIEGLLGSNIR